MTIDWSNIIVTGTSGIVIEMPEVAKVSIFTDNDLTHITDDHFKIKLIAQLLNQIYVIQPPISPCGDDIKIVLLYEINCMLMHLNNISLYQFEC